MHFVRLFLVFFVFCEKVLVFGDTVGTMWGCDGMRACFTTRFSGSHGAARDREFSMGLR